MLYREEEREMMPTLKVSVALAVSYCYTCDIPTHSFLPIALWRRVYSIGRLFARGMLTPPSYGAHNPHGD